MTVFIHDEQPLEKWRDGVMTRMRMSALLGGKQLCIFDQFCDFGLGAPTHTHTVEEVLEVINGAAEIWLGDETMIVKSNQSVPDTRWRQAWFPQCRETDFYTFARHLQPAFLKPHMKTALRCRAGGPPFSGRSDCWRGGKRRSSPGHRGRPKDRASLVRTSLRRHLFPASNCPQCVPDHGSEYGDFVDFYSLSRQVDRCGCPTRSSPYSGWSRPRPSDGPAGPGGARAGACACARPRRHWANHRWIGIGINVSRSTVGSQNQRRTKNIDSNGRPLHQKANNALNCPQD